MISHEVATKIVQPIIEALDSDQLPPWVSGLDKKALGFGNMPRNIVSKREYRGLNVFTLLSRGYSSPLWGTFKSFKKLNAAVNKGEKGTVVFFWKRTTYTTQNVVEDDSGEHQTEEKIKQSFYLKTYTVFNAEQTNLCLEDQDIPVLRDLDPEETCGEADELINDFFNREAVALHFKFCTPCYTPSTDRVALPEPAGFNHTKFYYNAMFHEMGHSTGHKSRLNREFGKRVQNTVELDRYSKEELVAEMTSAMCLGHCGLFAPEIVENSAAYIKHWKSKIKEDPTTLIYAGSQAQKAFNWILEGKAY